MDRRVLGAIGPKGTDLASIDRALDRATVLYPEEVLASDYVLIQQSDGIKIISANNLAGALGVESMGGWSPASIGSSAYAFDFSRRDTLHLDTSRLVPMLHDGTVELLAGVTDLSGRGGHLSQSTSTQRPDYNSAQLVNGYNYIQSTNQNDVQMVTAQTWTPGTNWSICWAAYVPSAGLKADWTFPVLCGTDTSELCVGYDENGAIRIHGLFGFSTETTVAAPLDEWHGVIITYDTAVGLKVWVNDDELTVGDIDTGRNWVNTDPYLMRDAPNGVDPADNCGLMHLYANTLTYDADHVALVKAFNALRVA